MPVNKVKIMIWCRRPNDKLEDIRFRFRFGVFVLCVRVRCVDIFRHITFPFAYDLVLVLGIRNPTNGAHSLTRYTLE